MMTCKQSRIAFGVLACCAGVGWACSSAEEGSDDSGAAASGATGSGVGGSGAFGAGAGASGTEPAGSAANGSVLIEGGGALDAPLGQGCGPETAGDCYPAGGACDGADAGDYQLVSAEQICFYGAGRELPAAAVEHIIETYDGQQYVHIRVTFDPDFVDNVYGECAADTGWTGDRGHTFRDLVGSDHLELMLLECDGDLAMHFKLDYLSADADAPCGYRSLGVTGGEGRVFVGDAAHVLAASSSIDRNLNGCGYCETETSPCPGEHYEPTSSEPNWDYRVVYEVWVSPEAFDESGFCGVDIERVHASPAKSDDNTIYVDPGPCPPTESGGGGTGGSAGAPGAGGSTGGSAGSTGGGGTAGSGGCPPGWVPDLQSEGQFCVPA